MPDFSAGGGPRANASEGGDELIRTIRTYLAVIGHAAKLGSGFAVREQFLEVIGRVDRRGQPDWYVAAVERRRTAAEATAGLTIPGIGGGHELPGAGIEMPAMWRRDP